MKYIREGSKLRPNPLVSRIVCTRANRSTALWREQSRVAMAVGRMQPSSGPIG